MTKFYVYQHWRSDLGVCFYVGKGQGNRAYQLDRNKRHNHIVQKLKSLGILVEVRIVANQLTETEALELEIKLIKEIGRRPNGPLVNLTDGGDLPPSQKGIIQSPETIQKRTVKLRGQKRSPETIEKLRQANLGAKRSDEAKAKMRIAKLGKKLSPEHRAKLLTPGRNNPRPKEWGEAISRAKMGHPVSEETKAKIRQANKSGEASVRKQISETLKKRYRENPQARVQAGNANRGKKFSEERKQQHSAAIKASWIKRKASKLLDT